MSTKPKISLCVIVKDQAALLRRLLEHHRDLYDEAIVVDTGSSDTSTEVARDLGALVGHFPWRDDFSAARNHGLDMATGDWNLVLDCDELIAGDDFVTIKDQVPITGDWNLVLDCDELIAGDDFALLAKLTSSPPDKCWFLPQLNYLPTPRGHGWETVTAEQAPFSMGAQGLQVAWTMRFFPNLPTLRYRGAVHETLEEAANKAGLAFKQENIPVHHQGHVLETQDRTHRTGFYGRLLAKKIQEQPRDPQTRYEMSVHLAGVGQGTLAGKILKRTLAEFPDWGNAYRARLLLGQIRMQNGDHQEAARDFHSALTDRPDWPACWEAVIASKLVLGDPSGASECLAQARHLFPNRPAWAGFEAQVSRDWSR